MMVLNFYFISIMLLRNYKKESGKKSEEGALNIPHRLLASIGKLLNFYSLSDSIKLIQERDKQSVGLIKPGMLVLYLPTHPSSLKPYS